MTKTAIMKVINEVNTNKGIKWSVLENTDSKIVLTNDYDKCVKLRINLRVNTEDNERWIAVWDDPMKIQVDCLLQGDSVYDDYKTEYEGIEKAIKAAVRYFNSRY